MARRRTRTGAPQAEATPTFVAPAHWRAIDLLSRPAPGREHAARVRRLGGAPAAHRRRRGLHPRRPVRGLGRRRHGRARLRGALRRGARAPPRRDGRSRFMAGNRDFLVGDALLEATGVVRLADPTVVVAFGERVAGLARRRALHRRRRLPALSRGRAPRRACSARSAPCRSAPAQRHRPRACADAAARREPRGQRQRSSTSMPMPHVAWLRGAEAPTLVHGHTHAPASHDLGARRSSATS